MVHPLESELRMLLTPPGVPQNGEEAQRSRAWMATCLVAAPLATAFAAMRWASGAQVLSVIDLAGAAGFVGSAAYLQRTGDLLRAVQAASALGIVLLTQAILLGGGLTGAAMAWYGMIPLSASLALGRERTKRWTAVVLPLPFLLFAADTLGWLPASAMNDVTQIAMYTLFIAAMGSMARTYEHMTDGLREERDAARLALEEERRKTSDLEISRTQLVKNVSHEFRTPLNHILGATQLLGHTTLDEEQQELVSMAEASGSDLLGIIDGAIQAQSLDSEIDMVSEPLDLGLIVSRLARAMSSRAKAKGLEFIVELDPSLPERSLGDPRRIEQVVHALLENALAFTPSGTIHLRAIYRGRGKVRFEVEDTGVGIRSEDFDRIFDAFRQVDESDSRSHGGLGTGLAVCRRLARHMGGDVSVHSVFGAGSTFTFDLVVEKERKTETGDVGVDAGATRRREDHVLLATPNPRTRTGSLAMLTKMGVSATGVESAAGLIDALRKESFTLVLVDTDMQGVAGLDAALRNMQGEASLEDTLFVALTPADGPPPSNLPRAFRDEVPKPLRKEQVVEILRKQAHTRAA